MDTSIRKCNGFGYYGSVINDCFIDGAQGSPSKNFGELAAEDKEIWESFAKQYGLNVVEFYNNEGTQIKLSQLQTYIIMILQEKYNKQIENNYDPHKKNWMKNGNVSDADDLGLIHITAASIAKDIYGNTGSENVKKVRNAIFNLKSNSGYLYYYKRIHETNKLVLRIEYCSLIVSYGIDTSDNRIKNFNWVRLHPIFFSALSMRYIRCRYFTARMSEFFDYKLPPFPAMTLFRYLIKFGNAPNNEFQIYSYKLMNIVCHSKFKKREISNCRIIIHTACEACKYIGVIKNYNENIVGENGDMKYLFNINPAFFRKETNKKNNEE